MKFSLFVALVIRSLHILILTLFSPDMLQKFFLYTLAITALLIASCSGEVVSLNDATFEHQTQASTGMTTGSWLLFFKAKRCPHCAKLEPEYRKLAVDEELSEKGFVLATVDIMESPRTANRFMIRGFPYLIFLHKKKLYRYEGKRDAESIKEFLTNGIHSMEGEEIPPLPSQWQHIAKTFKAVGLELVDAAKGKSGKAGYAILAMCGMLASIFIGIFAMCFMPAKKIKSS